MASETPSNGRSGRRKPSPRHACKHLPPGFNNPEQLGKIAKEAGRKMHGAALRRLPAPCVRSRRYQVHGTGPAARTVAEPARQRACWLCDDGPCGTTPLTLWGMKCLAMHLLRNSLPCQCWTSGRRRLAAVLRHEAPEWQKIRNKAPRFEHDNGAPRQSGSLGHWMGPPRDRLQMGGPLLVLDPQERSEEGNERRKTKARAARGLSMQEGHGLPP